MIPYINEFFVFKLYPYRSVQCVMLEATNSGSHIRHRYRENEIALTRVDNDLRILYLLIGPKDVVVSANAIKTVLQ